MHYYGEFGGRVLRKFTSGGVDWIVNAPISAETAMEWPLANRKALYHTHKIEWYGPPVEEVEQRPAPPKPPKAAKPPVVSKPDSTKATSRRRGK